MHPFMLIILVFAFAALFSSLTQSAKNSNRNNKPGGAQPREGQGEVHPEAKGLFDMIKETIMEAAEAEAQKPIIPHSTDACTGGSIHDGYHEGTPLSGLPRSEADNRRTAGAQHRAPNAAAGGKRNAGAWTAKQQEDEIPVETAAGAQTLAKAMADYPPAVQGVIWSEVLNPPVSMR